MNFERKSPVSFPARPLKSEKKDGWNVVLEYVGETGGPLVIDLSHCPKWDLQDADLSGFKPSGTAVPQNPGKSVLENGVLINRMNRTQASIWCFSERVPETGPAFTETTDALLLLALTGPNIFAITEKLTALELADAGHLLLGPFSHVPCQIVVLNRTGRDGVLLIACSRGYGRDMTHAILEAGGEFGLRPGGELAFTRAVKEIEDGKGRLPQDLIKR